MSSDLDYDKLDGVFKFLESNRPLDEDKITSQQKSCTVVKSKQKIPKYDKVLLNTLV